MATNPAAFNAIVAQIQNNSAGIVVDLSWQNITDVDCILLASALRTNTSVQILNLSSNFISDTGAIVLAQMLQGNMRLVELDLRNNHIQGSGAMALIEALRMNPVLNRFINPVSNPNGATALAQTLGVGTALMPFDNTDAIVPAHAYSDRQENLK